MLFITLTDLRYAIENTPDMRSAEEQAEALSALERLEADEYDDTDE